jgi:putative ABC transport system permease protein
MSWVQRLRQDLGYGWRDLIGTPVFTLIAVVALGIGIAANTTLFSMVDALLVDPYGIETGDLVIAVEKPPSLEFAPVSVPLIADWKQRNHTFESLVAVAPIELNLGSADNERILGFRVASDFFELLRVQPRLGRLFSREENENAGARVILLSHALWESRFQRNPEIVGKTVVLNGARYTVVGVARERLRFPHAAQFWIPLVPTGSEDNDREMRSQYAVGRLRPGVSPAQAEADLSSLTHQARRTHPDLDLYSQARVVRFSEIMTGSRTRVLVMMAAAVFVLLIACANVANMLLARASQREREIAIRAALGASRPRIVRQLLTESLLLAFIAGVLGLVLALWTTDALRSIYPPSANQFVPGFDQIRVTPRVIGFGFILCCVTALLFGLVPALRLSSINIHQVLQREAKSLTPSRVTHRFRQGLVIAESALALMLVVTALLTARSFHRLEQESAVFRPNTLVAAMVGAPPEDSHQIGFSRYLEAAVTRLSEIDGVQSAAGTMLLPLASALSDFPFEVEGQFAPGERSRVAVNLITSRYFETLGVMPLQGRDLVAKDERPGEKVAVVSESFARRFWPTHDAVGHRIRIDPGRSPDWVRIVGVVPSVRYQMAIAKQGGKDNQDTVYLPIFHPDWQPLFRRAMCDYGLFMRVNGSMEPVMKSVRAELMAIDPSQTIMEINPMTVVFDEVALSAYRSVSIVTGILALVALFLAAIGIYGVVSYTVSMRTQEIGIRLALGAPSASLLRWVVWQGMLPCLIGLAIGAAASLFSCQVLGSALFGYTPYDATTSAFVVVLLALVALGASFIPARAALRIDPAIAMRAS